MQGSWAGSFASELPYQVLGLDLACCSKSGVPLCFPSLHPFPVSPNSPWFMALRFTKLPLLLSGDSHLIKLAKVNGNIVRDKGVFGMRRGF